METRQPNDFEAVVLPHLDAAHNLARYLVRNEDDAQDVTQQAVLRALKYFASFRGDNPRAWLLAIVCNSARSWRVDRAAADVMVEFDEEVHGESAGGDRADAALIRAADHEQVRLALDELPAEFREVIVLRELQDLTYREIASIVDAPLGTVMSRLSRARRRLQIALGARKTP